MKAPAQKETAKEAAPAKPAAKPAKKAAKPAARKAAKPVAPAQEPEAQEAKPFDFEMAGSATRKEPSLDLAEIGVKTASPAPKTAAEQAAEREMAEAEARAKAAAEAAAPHERVIPAAEKSGGHFKVRFTSKWTKVFRPSAADEAEHERAEASPAGGAGDGRKKGFSKLFQSGSALREALTREKILAIASDKQNIAIAIGVTASALALAALLRSGHSPEPQIDTDNPFVTVTEVGSGRTISGANADAVARAVQEREEQDAGRKADEEFARQPGFTFRDEAEFRKAVRTAMSEIRAEDVQGELQKRSEAFKAAAEKIPSGEKIYGNPDARFRITEYSDVECPYCKQFFATPGKVADLSNGQVSVVWKNFPLQFHDPAASREALALQCVYKLKGNRAFWVALDRLFGTTSSNGQGSRILDELGDEMGIPEGDFTKCLADPETAKAIEADKAEAAKKGVSSTPSVVITDTLTGISQTITGAVPAEQIMNAIEQINTQASAKKGQGRKGGGAELNGLPRKK